MIIEQLDAIRDGILTNQSYFDKGFSDCVLVQDTTRDGIFMISSQGEHEYAALYDYNFFYIRPSGPISVTGGPSEKQLQGRYRLIAFAKDVDLYKFIDCMLSALATFCNQVSITSVELRAWNILIDETKKPEIVKAIMSRIHTQNIIAVEFSLYEFHSQSDLNKCNCNPCKTC
jgi:hypothetical protein